MAEEQIGKKHLQENTDIIEKKRQDQLKELLKKAQEQENNKKDN